jgi:hypothetical protein
MRVWGAGRSCEEALGGENDARPAIRHRPREVLSVVEWCGHRQELILVPDGVEWFREIPVLGVAR